MCDPENDPLNTPLPDKAKLAVLAVIAWDEESLNKEWDEVTAFSIPVIADPSPDIETADSVLSNFADPVTTKDPDIVISYASILVWFLIWFA